MQNYSSNSLQNIVSMFFYSFFLADTVGILYYLMDDLSCVGHRWKIFNTAMITTKNRS